MKKRFLFWVLLFTLMSCISDSSFSVSDIVCEEPALLATHSLLQIKEMAGYGIVSFDTDIIIEGYVVSTDASGNIYKSISIQDKYQKPSAALWFSVDKTNLYAVFPVGRKVYVKLKGLSIGYSRGALQIGKAVGNELERIPDSEVFNHFIRSCNSEELIPNPIKINQIDDAYLETLIQLDNVQFREEDIGNSFGEPNSTKTINRVLEQLTDCELNSQINVSISGFSDFKSKELPVAKGNIVGILTKYYSDYQLILRSEEDVVDMNKARCEVIKTNGPTISYAEIIAMYADEVVEFGTDKEYVFEGYVISSDQEGNFTNKIFIQDKVENSMGGFQLLIDENNLFEHFQVGDRILLKLNHLYLDKVDGVYTVGVYKDGSVGQIKGEEIGKYVFSTGENFEVIPRIKKLEEVSIHDFQNTLVTISEIQLSTNELGKAFAYYSGEEDGIRNLESCNVFNILELETLGTASFSHDKFPIGKGSITGVLYRDNSKLKMQIRSIKDVNFQEQRDICLEVISKILITEVADPENNVGARFVELFNAGDTAVSLAGWQLNKYLNGSSSVSTNGLDLTGLVIPSKGFIVLSNTGFNTVFSNNSDFISSYISGNGDDVYELVDRQGEIQDVFGVKGEDGTGMNWEYSDGKAIRKIAIENPNKEFTISEWEIFTKAKGNKQLAPENFSPKLR